MTYLSFSVDTSDIAGQLGDDGAALAEIMNEISRGVMRVSDLVAFAEGLDEDGRKLLEQLLEAVKGHDAEGG